MVYPIYKASFSLKQVKGMYPSSALFQGNEVSKKEELKSVDFKKPVTRISFLSKCCHFQYNLVLISEKMTTF